MAGADEAQVAGSVDDVMNQVLAAEREARDAVERCRKLRCIALLAYVRNRLQPCAQDVSIAHRPADASDTPMPQSFSTKRRAPSPCGSSSSSADPSPSTPGAPDGPFSPDYRTMKLLSCCSPLHWHR